MKKILFAVLSIFGILFLISVWYLHASIYWKLERANVLEPSDIAEYTIGVPSATQVNYVAIGDSLTAGVGVDTYTKSYPYLIAKKISDDHVEVSLKPFAVPGVRSAYVLRYFMEPVIASNPDIITLFIGVNDIHGNVPSKQFKEQYAQILTELTGKTHAQIYVINLPYIGTGKLISLPYRVYFNWRTEQYNVIIKQLAAEYDVTYIDLYTAHNPKSLDNDYYASDFFHPNELGYILWSQFIYADFHK